MDDNLQLPVYKQFEIYIKNQKVTYISIASELSISRSHLTRLLSGERPLTDEIRSKLNILLDTSF